jgi:hypothetical protein
MHIWFWWENQKETKYFEKIELGGRMDLRETGWDDMDWIDLAEDTDQWRDLVITVMKLRVP